MNPSVAPALDGRIERWLDRGDVTLLDLARFRILFAVVGLVRLPSFAWAADLPDTFYDPPPGPMMLFGGFPPEPVLAGLEVVLAAAYVAILIGWHTRVFSLVATIAGLLGFGFVYSLGKIDHNILIVILPVFLAHAGWGETLSIDASRGRAVGDFRPWVLRLFAVAIGIAMATAALPKLRGGWLDTGSQAVWAQIMVDHTVRGADSLLGRQLLTIDAPLLWEAADWFTVGLEAIVLLSVLWWPFFRAVLATLAIFHLFVLLTLEISFVANVVAYGAFVRWGRFSLPFVALPSPTTSLSWLGHRRWLPGVVVVAGGLAAWNLLPQLPNVDGWVWFGIPWAGAAIGGWYLVRTTSGGLRTVSAKLRS